jgi:rubredoxin
VTLSENKGVARTRFIMAELTFERCEATDPHRCQGIVRSGPAAGQCFFKAVPNSTFCPRCGGGSQAVKNEQVALRNYKLTQYAERVGQLAGNSEIKSLREEIGIVRMTLESLLNSCTTQNQVLIYIDKINSLVDNIKKLIESSQKLEEKNNNLLDRNVVIVIGDSIVGLLAQYIKDPDELNEIGVKICESIARAASGADSGRLIA